MKTALSLAELATRLTEQGATKQDFVAPAASIIMTPSAEIDMPAADLFSKLLTKHAHGQLASTTGIPAPYYDRMRTADPELLSHNVNRWMREARDEKGNPRRHTVRMLDGRIRALLSDSYQRIDNEDVAEVVLNILYKQPGLRIVSCDVTETKMYIKAVTNERPLAVPGSRRVGDLVEKGVMISNSEIGAGAVTIKPFAHFLVCTNGMVRDDGKLRAAHLGKKIDAGLEGLLSEGTRRMEDQVVLRKVQDVVNHAFDDEAFSKFIAKIGATTQQPITGDINATIEALGPTMGLQVGERSSVLRHLVEGGDLSRYGLVNAITRTAEDLESYDRATDLETMGFRLADMANHDWLRIASAKPMALAA